MANERLQFGQTYHIYNRGNNGENLFVQARNYKYFLQKYAKYIQPIAFTFAYCLLPNHFHFLIRTFTEEEQEAYFREQQIGPIFEVMEPSRAFNNLFIAYARAFNRATQRTGVLFERPFGRKVVDHPNYFVTLVTYIHRNPQKHGLIADFREWPWSSYYAIESDKETKLARDDVLGWFNGRAAFKDAHLHELDEQLTAPLIADDWL